MDAKTQEEIIRKFVEDYKVVGREITLDECSFVFSRIWKTTINCLHDAKDEHKEDHIHQKEEGIVMLDDLFHIVDLAGVLLNKAAPSDEDTRPYDEFMKYAEQQLVTNKDGGEEAIVQFVPVEHLPKVIYGIFISSPDEKRIDAVNLIDKYMDQGDNDEIVKYIVEHIWAQYDLDGCGNLNRSEARNFIGMVLDMFEITMAKKEGRTPKDISEKEIEEVFAVCDVNHDGHLSKDEVH